MINNDNEYSTDSKTTITSSDDNNSIMSSDTILSKITGEEQSVQNTNNDQNNSFIDKQLVDVQQQPEEGDDNNTNNDDEFIRITAAHQMLTEAQTYDEQKNYPAALHLYRICVDLLLEELMFTEGTEQSRVYLREKCTAIMDRIDLLKTMLDPIPPPPPEPLPSLTTTTTETNEQEINPPTDDLNSLHLS